MSAYAYYLPVDFFSPLFYLPPARYAIFPLQSKEKNSLKELAEGWFYDSLQKTILHESVAYELTKKEAKLIELLLQKDSIITYEEIEEKLWEHEYMSLNALRLMVKNLRKKLPEGILKNIQGIGYKL